MNILLRWGEPTVEEVSIPFIGLAEPNLGSLVTFIRCELPLAGGKLTSRVFDPEGETSKVGRRLVVLILVVPVSR